MVVMVEVQVNSSNTMSFEERAKQVLQQFRGAFAEVVDALPGLITRPHELSKSLKIDMKLAWKIMKVAHGSDLFAAAQHIPGSLGIKVFLKAAARQSVPAPRIRAVEAAVGQFERLIEVHAGDRATLEMMLASYGGGDRRQADLAQQKAAFTAQSYIWGVQARTQLKVDFLHPATEKGRLDIATLRGFVGLRRIRPNVPWVIARARVIDDDGKLRSPSIRKPLDPTEDDADGITSAPLLREFCSKPLPRFRRIVGPHGFLEDELAEGEVGNTGAITCITGDVAYNAASYYRAEHNRYAALAVLMRTPCEALLFDLFVHEDLFGSIEPELAVYSELAGGPPIPPIEGRERDRLDTWEQVEYLGKGPSVVHTPHVPRHAEMIRYTLDKLGWDSERFDVYRVQMQFPIIPTSVLMMHELPEAPQFTAEHAENGGN
ncbi:MAG: hypothetical protein KAV82_11510 [Phycisphaerae bacterium]|nr:hypothetical protein [Phycisphaerae bacterium]